MIPEGRYKARAIDGGLGEASNGNPQIAVCFELLDEDYVGQTINWFGSFSKTLGKGEKTPLQRTIESLRVCGWIGDDLSSLEGITANEVQLIIEHEEYKGETTAKVKWVNRPGGLALKAPMSIESAKAFAAKMRGEVIAAARQAPAPSTNGKKPARGFPTVKISDVPEGPPPSDDDIPF